VVAAQDPEAILAGGVLHVVGNAVGADVRVLANAVAGVVGLLLEDGSVLSGEGGSGASVTGVEALLLQDLGALGVDVEGLLGGARSDDTSEDDLEGGVPTPHNGCYICKALTKRNIFVLGRSRHFSTPLACSSVDNVTEGLLRRDPLLYPFPGSTLPVCRQRRPSPPPPPASPGRCHCRWEPFPPVATGHQRGRGVLHSNAATVRGINWG
jgi:hypothetical protein